MFLDLATDGEVIEALPLPRDHMLIDACDTARWRLLLNTAQRHNLKSTLHDVLLTFGMCTGQISRDAIASAHNCLLDAVLEHCARDCRALEHLRRAAS